MKIARTVLLAAGLALATAPAQAGSLYEDLGGKAGIDAFVGRTIDLSFTDPRIAHTFKNSKPDYLKKMISEQFCALSGGPCTYTGVDMKKSHQGLGLTSLHFNALVEVLQQAMREAGIPSAAQNRLLALLAPMHRDVVEK